MRTPSIKTLITIAPHEDRSIAVRLKKVFRITRQQLLETEIGAARNAECYNAPKTWDIRMTVLNSIAETYGIESIETENGEYASYLNAGDTYIATIIFWRGQYRVQSLGDFIETMGRNGVRFK